MGSESGLYSLRGSALGLGLLLERFPLPHQVSHFPHQGLMSIDYRLGRLVVVVEAGGGHLRLDLLDLGLFFRDACLELFDATTTHVLCLALLARLGLLALSVLIVRLPASGFRLTAASGFALRASGTCVAARR